MTTHKQVITLAKECFYCYEDAKGRPEYSANEYALERFYAIAFDAGRVAERESKLSDHIKREVLLRVKLSEIAWSNDSKWQSDCAKESLAATADLSGLILCHAEPCRDDGRCQYAIDHGAEGLGHCPEGKCCMPLYRAAKEQGK